MFVVSLLLNQVLGWMRAQPGTSSLRALLFMDEIYGFFPPVAHPPAKPPLLALLKQARAFGLGVLLATQNPVDLDYKGLANAGTWFLGRLQTERDKARVLEGLEGAAAGAGQAFDRGRMEATLAGLGSRVFLMNNVHDDAPAIFETRWTMSYLRGPLTRDQIKRLRETAGPAPAPAPPRAEQPAATPAAAAPSALPAEGERSAQRPVLPPEVPQVFVPVRGTRPAAALVYGSAVIGAAQIHFLDPKLGVDTTRDVVAVTSVGDGPLAVNWDESEEVAVALGDLERDPLAPASFIGLPAVAGKARSYETWSRDFSAWAFRTQRLEILRSAATDALSAPGESEREFRARLGQVARERRDQLAEKLRQKYAPKVTQLTERIRKAEAAKERESGQARTQHFQTVISFGATLLGAFLGRKALSTSTMGRAATTANRASRSMKESGDVARAAENVEALKRQLADLEAEFQAETERLAGATDPLGERLEPVVVRPSKTNVAVKLLALAWLPYWQEAQGVLTPAWQ
jgi:hypothetical protein